jgi:TetR/AcrR family transcriptional repressor of nem operon
MDLVTTVDRTTAKRAELLQRGAELLCERGYHGTGLKQILAAVGIPKGSFYNYFSSKEEFVGEVIRHAAAADVERLDRELRDHADAPGSAAERLRAALDRQVDAMAEGGCRRGCLFGNLAAEMGETSEVCREATEQALAAIRDRYQAALELGQAEGTVRQDVPAAILADFLIDAWEGSILRMKVVGSAAPLRGCLDLVFEHFFRPRAG